MDQEELAKIMCNFDDDEDASMHTAKAELTKNEDSLGDYKSCSSPTN